MEETKIEINLGEIFYEGLARQIRSIDSYGSYAKYSDEDLISMKFIKKDGAENLKQDQITLNIKLYLQTITVALESLEKHIVGLMTESGCDGSVKAMLYTGQLILLDKTFGSLNGFQFANMEKLKDSGGKLLARLRNIIAEKSKNYKELMD